MQTQSQDDDNQWPGYVDALTTMTMMLIFIMVILTVAIFGMSQNVARDIVERIARVVDVETSGDIATLVDKLERKIETEHLAARAPLRSKIAPERSEIALAAPVTMPTPAIVGDSILVQSSVPAIAPPQPRQAAVSERDAMLRIAFDQRAIALDPAADGRIETFLRNDPRFSGPGLLEVKAFASPEDGVTDARRLAFYRLMNVRSKLLQLGIPAQRIQVRVHDREPGAAAHEVTVFMRDPA
jgi:hypothetical protein